MAGCGGAVPALWLAAVLAGAAAQVLTPPYFNLAENRRITATATCGENVADPELYCKLVGANADRDATPIFIQGGQWCDRCDPNVREKAHPPEYAIDGSERWWQSPPLSRGMKYNKVNLTVDLGQLFQVAYVLIKMGNSPRPGVWILERSVDNGKTYTPWQYFADSEGDCENFFGKESLNPITDDDDVICVTHFSKVVPLEGGEIVVSLLNNRPSANSFFNSSALQEFTRATNVRLRLLRTKTLLGHLMSVARQDPTVTRRYFYSIKDISIGGRCVCNGHADVCDITDPNDLYKLQCRCQHNTCGSQCEMCCPGFIQKKWRPAGYQDGFVCEPCNCYGHTDECIFSEEVNEKRLSRDIYGIFEGGGVCQNCQHNTEGINCDKCISGYYKPYDKELNDTDVCQPCNCNSFYNTGNCAEGSGQCECRPEYLPPYCDACNDGYYDYPDCKPCDCHRIGTFGSICEVGGGQCPCKDNYDGLNCDKCAPNYYNFPECLPCNCSETGSLDDSCDTESGQCNCKNEFGGRTCDRCEHGYYDHPTCKFCNCDAQGTEEEICDKDTGICLCLEGFSSIRCDNSAPGYWGYPHIQTCGCHEKGSASSICDAAGDCACLTGFSGRACDQCSPGYFSFPECIPCNCDQAGSIGISCDKDGKCQCKPNYSGVHCDMCLEGFYNFPLCEECNCNPAGVLETFGGCGDAPVGELCQCKERVAGRICDSCKPLFWNLRQENHFGCEECGCYTPGTIGGMASCNSETGQCFCKPGVVSRQCDICRDGTFNLLEDNLFGCSDCGCNVGGSVDNICDKSTGQCRCRPRVTGQQCDQPLQLHYFPTLYQLKYEAEDGHTPQNTAVRFGYDDEVFPNYSWRGYAVFSDIQKEIIQEVYIEKPSLYRMVLFYHNPGSRTVVGKIRITPDDPSDTEQEVDIHFPPTRGPQLMTLMDVPRDFPVPLVMNPGRWSIAIENNQNLLLDYFVILPLAYYEGTILTKNVTSPCMMGHTDGEMCLHYAYPDIFQYNYIYGSAGYRSVDGERHAVELYDDYEVLSELDTQPMAWLNHNQPDVQYDLRLARPGRHILLINYYTPDGATTTNVIAEISTHNGREKGRAILYDCTYSAICRQVFTDLSGRVGIFHFDSNFISLNIKGEDNTNIGIESIVAVPYEYWHQDLISPNPVCTRFDGLCLESSYPNPPESTKVEFESNLEGKVALELPEGVANGTVLVYLNHSDPMVDIVGKLRYAGKYVFVVHYYQPLYPDDELYVQVAYSSEKEFDVDVLIQNGQFYESLLPVHHCPSTSGCRSVIQQPSGSYVFDILENFVLSFKEPNHKSLWLDYVLVFPAEQFTQEILHEMPIDTTAEFINLCGQDNFNIDANATGFCKDAAFELTMEYNSGALPCQCDFHGSESFECEKFGGQCPCRPYVIGRRCNRCKTGYFGFPHCKPCDCPSTALCDPATGECICPPRVEGDRCERCALYTYGFDPIIGCEECQCSPLGVRSGDLQCNLQTGHCDCKDSVVGRRCERCEAGYWSFPFCQLCDCDLRGTEEDICNQDDASCYCKTNVRGHSCDSCQPGSYNLEESNPDGCTKCFCFGKSEYCSSADVYWEDKMMDDMSAWDVVVVEESLISQGLSSPSETTLSFTSLAQPPTHYEDLILQELQGVEELFPEGHVFFTAPDVYLGNHITSYGGYLKYSLMFVRGNDGSELRGPDVVLKGGNIIAQYFSSYEPSSSETFSADVRLTEHNFRTSSGLPLQRDQFMMLLHGLDVILIRANYWTNSVEARLSNVSIDAPTANWPGPTARPALSVELCQCPINYEGSSCEDCANGYYRAQRGPYGGYCVPCQCNGHAEMCDKETGKCLNCLHNTVGDHCEMCAPGYHGKATQGTPYDCLICACPMPSITNNFAESCDFLDDGYSISCECQEGYIGQRCERCASGYYGQPEILGDKCKPCECSGNIDQSDPFACDDISGRCLNCLNNTYGYSCERCAPGFYGDAINLKNCEMGVVVCEYHGTTYGTSRTKQQPRTGSSTWSGSTRYAHSRTSSRYATQRPLDDYRKQFGSSFQGQNRSSFTSTSGIQQPWRYRNTGQYRHSWTQGYSNPGREGIRNTSQEVRDHQYGRTHTIQAATVPPMTESSYGFTHYTTLHRNGRNRGRGRTRRPHPYPAPQGRQQGRFGKKKERIAGEGYGEAYLEWSEYGVGCSCNECGTRNCQHFSGVCECYDNVIGNQCDFCAADHWGFASCQGCQPCHCGTASWSSQCNEGTGQCQCKSGVTGQRCDQCSPGFWNYTRYGCQECTCREGFSVGVGCDPRTGQCECLPGVIGTNCESCPYRWVLVDGVGCQECEECVHALLDTTDELSRLIQPTIFEFETAAYSYFLHQRLGVINSTVLELRPQVNLMDLSEAETLPLQDPLESIVKEAHAISSQTGIVFDRAESAGADSFRVHIEALKVQEDVHAAFSLARGIIAEINKLVIGLETGTGAQLEQAIHEAEAVVAEMEKRNFEGQRDKVEVELERAKEMLESMKAFYDPIKGQRGEMHSYEDRLKNFESKIEEMRHYIQEAKQQTVDAEQKIRNSRIYGYNTLKKTLDEIHRLDGQIENSLEESQDLVDQTRRNLENATANYDVLVMEIEHLRAVKSTLNGTVARVIQELEEAQLPAQRAEGHAELLRVRAEELDDLLADTREVAENALAAANAYKNIVLAIDDAYNASISANMSALKAVVMSEGVSDEAVQSQRNSEEKYSLAAMRVQQVEKELHPQLIQAQEDVLTLKDMNLYISDSLAVINSGLDSLEQEAVSESATRLEQEAVQSREEADEAIHSIASVEGLISKAAEDARTLMKNVAEGEKAIELANDQVERVEQVIPDMTETAVRLRAQKEEIQTLGIDVGDRLEKLRRSIQKTRELANKIKVGVSFLPNTTIELENPADLTKAATSTKLSVFVQTEEPSGLIMFMGTPVGHSQRMRRTTTDDFIALEVDRGFARLTMDLGAGAHSIEYNKLYIADGVWSKIIVERTGKVVKLSVHREEMEGEPVETVLPGRFSVFNLDPKVSKIYVGGIPAGVKVDRAIASTSFYGQMEDLRVNDHPIGLWNFMNDGTNNNHQRGALERDRLVDLVPPTGLRFDGNGYAAMDTRNGYRFERQFDLQMSFKTYAEDGILFMIHGGPGLYMSVTMEEGHMIFQYNLGSGVVTMKSTNTYHDGEWHRVEVARQQRSGILKVASETIQGESPGVATEFLSVPAIMFFGGYPGEHDFIDTTNDDFNGCIDKILISSVTVDLSKSTESLSTAPGCPIQVASLVSFDKSAPGYVKYDSPEGSGLQLVFKFKTDEPDGLIFYTSTSNQGSYLSLSLAESALILRAAPGGELTTGSYDKYNDSEWHVVIATREHNELRLDIDDFKSYKVKVAEQAVPFDGPVFFGGVPEVYNIAAAASATDTNFFGCIGDATLNSKIVNFAQSQDRPNAHLQKCLLQKSSSIFEKPSVGQEVMRTNVSDYEDVSIIVEQPKFPSVVEVDFESSPPHPPIYIATTELSTSFTTEDVSTLPSSPATSSTTTGTSTTMTSTPSTTTTTTSTTSTTITSTTTTTATTTEEIRPEVTQTVPSDSCALPLQPMEEDVAPGEGFRFDEHHDSGYDFGSKPNSRIEFRSLPDNPRANFKFSFEFKTVANEGIIFYGAGGTHRDYITFYLKDGKIVFSFNAGDGAAMMRSEQLFNDGVWHSAVVERQEEYGMLLIDGFQVANGTDRGVSRYIDLEAPFYYGGVSSEVKDLVNQNTEGTEFSFKGCLRNIRMNNQRIGGPHEAFSLIRCSENVEPGVFFGDGIRAHVILRKRFSVGRVFEMTMDIKPRKNSGVIASVHGRRDFVMLQLKDGSVELSVDNGKGIITARYTPSSPWMLCDGNWHSIQVIKNKNIAILVVDGTSTNPVSGKLGATSTDTKNPLFLGSQPHVTRRRGGATSEKYVGCIRSVTVNKDPVVLEYTTFMGNVNAGSCPTI